MCSAIAVLLVVGAVLGIENGHCVWREGYLLHHRDVRVGELVERNTDLPSLGHSTANSIPRKISQGAITVGMARQKSTRKDPLPEKW